MHQLPILPYTDIHSQLSLITVVACGAIQVLRNAVGVGGCQISLKKALRRYAVQRYFALRHEYEGVGGVKFPGKKRYAPVRYD